MLFTKLKIKYSLNIDSQSKKYKRESSPEDAQTFGKEEVCAHTEGNTSNIYV